MTDKTENNAIATHRSWELLEPILIDGEMLEELDIRLPVLADQTRYADSDETDEQKRAWTIADVAMLPHDGIEELDEGDFYAVLAIFNDLSSVKQVHGPELAVPDDMTGVQGIDIPLFKSVEINGEPRDTVHFRRPKLKDQLKHADLPSAAKKEVAMIGDLCGLSPAQMEDVALTDYADMQRVYKAFLDSKRRRSAKSVSSSPSSQAAA